MNGVCFFEWVLQAVDMQVLCAFGHLLIVRTTLTQNPAAAGS